MRKSHHLLQELKLYHDWFWMFFMDGPKLLHNYRKQQRSDHQIVPTATYCLEGYHLLVKRHLLLRDTEKELLLLIL